MIFNSYVKLPEGISGAFLVKTNLTRQNMTMSKSSAAKVQANAVNNLARAVASDGLMKQREPTNQLTRLTRFASLAAVRFGLQAPVHHQACHTPGQDPDFRCWKPEDARSLRAWKPRGLTKKQGVTMGQIRCHVVPLRKVEWSESSRAPAFASWRSTELQALFL